MQSKSKVYAVISTKGGVGKTTLSANLGAMLADMGKRTLLIDTDPQQSLSRTYEITQQASGGLTQLYRSASTDGCISQTAIQGLDIVLNDDPHGDGAIPTFLRESVVHFQYLHIALLALRGYDYVVVDTQGSKGIVQESVIFAADTLVSPVVPQALDTREFVLGTVGFLNKFKPRPGVISITGRPIPPMRVVVNMWDRSKSAQESVNYLRSEFDKQLDGQVTVLNTIIPDLQVYADSVGMGTPAHREETRRRGPTQAARDTMVDLVQELEPKLLGLAPEWK